ncbi:hypothetical protein MGA3_17387 (plasmid) [Bacillus methanolicus MGA3]|uniref:Uncharacterized protein n=1 Tax=Bacillus methanolicus (strain MGA3 / ATCC 53907) TaxID=796606 RepID=I3DTM4_BACMM|nr:hypothetical protein BMMGA3_17205 [Bacillus methanolicus MGA3]EIJ77595.1 hypothetical protein MGA3_17387 [Bacillus methanolicus MGA3]
MKKLNHKEMEVSQKTVSRIMKDEGMMSRTVKNITMRSVKMF